MEICYLLNQFADEMYGPEEDFLKEKKHDDEGSEEEEEDLEAALKKEVQEMRDVKPKDRRFQVVDTGAKNCIFVRTTVDDPGEMVHKIMSDVYETKTSKVRHIQRMLPISHTCKAYKDDINALMPTILQPHLDKYPGGRPSFCVVFKVRNSNSVGRTDVYEVVGDVMMDCQVDTVNPDLVVIVEVIKTVCCISVVTDYFKFRKFNMHEIVQRTVDRGAVGEKTEKGVEGKGEEKAAGEVDVGAGKVGVGADVNVDVGDVGSHVLDGENGKMVGEEPVKAEGEEEKMSSESSAAVDGDEEKGKILDGNSGKVDGCEEKGKMVDGDSGTVDGDIHAE
ncbi:THUMP domain-containing protein 1-like isoform X2 [Lineus longissimus]|uniref:THUMP domain-containing protein 1-like isoform X2 n=1 Tax=Lineus longissimus TaxID=88925 RepID=UPI002B4CA0CF